MLLPPFENAMVLTGPTGSGKTALGIELAEELNAEIIAMDSMTLYRGLDIGTAKPTPEEQKQVRHHLLDVLEPWESSSIAWWLEQARQCCHDIFSRGKRVLFVGGTPLYLKALISGLFDGPPGDGELRRRLTDEARTLGSAHLHERLAAVDPISAGRIHSNDVRRIIRALEVYELTSKPMSAWQTQWSATLPCDSASHPNAIWLDMPRSELYERINQRVENMFASGWLEEAALLRESPMPLSREAAHALGYQEVWALLDGAISRDEAVVRVQARSRNYAKRQITWFRHLPGCKAVSKELTWKLWQPTMKR